MQTTRNAGLTEGKQGLARRGVSTSRTLEIIPLILSACCFVSFFQTFYSFFSLVSVERRGEKCGLIVMIYGGKDIERKKKKQYHYKQTQHQVEHSTCTKQLMFVNEDHHRFTGYIPICDMFSLCFPFPLPSQHRILHRQLKLMKTRLRIKVS